MKKTLGLIFGGRSGEHEVSLQSAKAIASNIDRTKFNLLLIPIDKKGNWYLAEETNYLNDPDNPAKISLAVNPAQRIALVPDNSSHKILSLQTGEDIGKLDAVFPIIHGSFGEDGALQGFLTMLDIPYVGADILGSAVGMDKVIAKQLLQSAGINVADYLVVDNTTDIRKIQEEVKAKIGFPAFVKPSCSGSSVGVYKVQDEESLLDAVKKALGFDRRVLIEKAIIGREIECAVLGNKDLITSVPGEIIPNHDFYSYEAKYIDDEGARLDFPAKLTEKEVESAKKVASDTYKALSCTGMARVDMFLTQNGELILNEINTLPGFTKISMYPKLMELSGVGFTDLINRLVDLAIDRHQAHRNYLENVLDQSPF